MSILEADVFHDTGTGFGDVGEDFGPDSTTTTYSDKATITDVQVNLIRVGYDPGPVDGKFGPKTEAALFAFSGKHGPPTNQIIADLRTAPDARPHSVTQQERAPHRFPDEVVSTAKKTSPALIAGGILLGGALLLGRKRGARRRRR